MREIGGYFELEHLKGDEYHCGYAINTASNALRLLIRVKNISRIFLPWYICETVVDACKKENVSIFFYRIDNNFHPIITLPLDDAYLYIVNYFGQLSEDSIRLYKEKYRHIILDNVQHFFAKPILGIDTLYSCRKYFGVPDGAYLYTDADINYVNIDVEIIGKRIQHLLGRFEGDANQWYRSYVESEQALAKAEPKKMSLITHNLLRTINYKDVMNRREQNYLYLLNNLPQTKLQLKKIIGPYAFPYYCKNGNIIREQLIKRKIYVPCLWPNINKDCIDDVAQDFARNIVVLPCDQRYEISDMKYIVESVSEIEEGI